ncbi:MAG TPA: hypothetical protein VH092_25145, partial [Urbifossiella sp.]|nr:hypothetical protein [Urbifossiella sp.]
MPVDPAGIKNVFLAAAALPPPGRPEYLAAACGADHDLRAAVERLLVEHDRPNSLLDTAVPTPDPGPGETHDPDSPDAGLAGVLTPPGEPGSLGRLDQYEVLGVVGRGGMGIVLKAHDTDLRRVVAIKVLAPGLRDNGAARRRFAREAQAAAAV